MEQHPTKDVTTIDELAQILFTNLLLLGMDVKDMETSYKITFNKDMFNLPNKVGAEAVLHFLFYRLSPTLSSERFRDSWPILDKKREMQFRKTCNSWIVSIQKNDDDAHLPKLNPALLLSPGGRKFIHLLYSLSTYVLTQVMKHEHGWKPGSALVYPAISQNNKSYGVVMSSSIKDSTIMEMKAYFNHLHLISGANRSWKAYSDELIKEYRGLTKKLREIENEKRQLVNVIADTAVKLGCSLPAKRTLTMFDSDMGVMGIKRGQRIEQARSRWKSLINFNELFNTKREIVQSIVDHTKSHHKLDGTDIGVCVPGLLLREFKKEIQQQQIDNVYVGGRLNLIPVLQMWNLCLRRYLEQISSEDLPDVSKEIADLSAQAHKQHCFLKDTQSLRDEMTNAIIPELENSIQELREKLSFIDYGNTQSSLGLELTKPASPMTASSESEMIKDSSFNAVTSQASQKDTPDAVMDVIQSVASKSQAAKSIQPSKLVHAFMNLSQTEKTPLSTSNREKVKRKVAPLKSAIGRGSTTSLGRKDSSIKKTPHPQTSKAKSSHQLSSVNEKVLSKAPKQKLSNKTPDNEGNLSIFSSPGIPSSVKSTGHRQNAKALDFLANSIVDSVMLNGQNGNSDDMDTKDISLNETNSSPLSRALASELEMSAFMSRDRLGRSPQESEHQLNASFKAFQSPLLSETRSSQISTTETPVRSHDISTNTDVSGLGETDDALISEGKEYLPGSQHLMSRKFGFQEENIGKDLPHRSHSQSTNDEQNSSNFVRGESPVDPFLSFFENINSKNSSNTIRTSKKNQVSDEKVLSHSSSSDHSTAPQLHESPRVSPTLNEMPYHFPVERRQNSSGRAISNDFHSSVMKNQRTGNVEDADIDYILGDRLCGDGEASEELTLPVGKVVSGNNDINTDNQGLLSSEGNGAEEEENGIDFALQTSRLVSSLISAADFPNNDSRQVTDKKKDKGQMSKGTSKGQASINIEPFLNFSGDMEGLIDLVESDIEEGLNDSFVPLRQGFHFNNSLVEREDLNIVSPLTKARAKAPSPEFLSHLLSSPSLNSPSVNSTKKSFHDQTDFAKRLAQLQAEAARVLDDDSDDDSL